MMKVRFSQIEESSGKPTFIRKHKGKASGKKLIGDIDEEEDDETSSDSEKGEDDDEKKRLSKTMIIFKEEGLMISSWDLHTMEKDTRFVEKPKAHWEYGIAINKGLNTSQFVNKTDIFFWYQKEEVRDEKFEKILEILKVEGLNVIEI